jgi:hypothetical protein
MEIATKFGFYQTKSDACSHLNVVVEFKITNNTEKGIDSLLLDCTLRSAAALTAAYGKIIVPAGAQLGKRRFNYFDLASSITARYIEPHGYLTFTMFFDVHFVSGTDLKAAVHPECSIVP